MNATAVNSNAPALWAIVAEWLSLSEPATAKANVEPDAVTADERRLQVEMSFLEGCQ